MSQSSYAKIAGLQSEIGRVVITRIAGSELEYKRALNMYRKDVTCAVNNIRREQIKMRMRLGRYVRKLKQTRVEHAKRIKEQKRRDKERAHLEELHIRLKYEAAAKTPEPGDFHGEDPLLDNLEQSAYANDLSSVFEPVTPPQIDFKSSSMFLQTGTVDDSEDIELRSEDKTKNVITKSRKQSLGFAPILAMIDEGAEKESEEIAVGNKEILEPDRFDLKLMEEDVSVSSYGGRVRKKNAVSFTDILKLKYTGTKNLFDLVHRLAKKHGISDVVERVPDPRDNVVHRGAANDSLRLQAAVLYPMKYGYGPEYDTHGNDIDMATSSNSPVVTETERDAISVSENGQKSKRYRRVSLKHSRSLDESEDHYYVDVVDKPRRAKSRDLSMPELVDKVNGIKLEQADRLSSSQRLENEMISNYNLLSPYKPSSSRSSRSLPAISKTEDKKNVSWTQAFGIIRGIRSLEDVSA